MERLIENYSFGTIIVDGETYHHDVILCPDKIEINWIRQESHSLVPEDIAEIISYQPEILIVGTGAYGVLQVPSTTVAMLKRQHIRLIAEPTARACEIFNEYVSKGQKVVGAFHLTC